MEWGTISTASLIGMAFTLAVSVLGPVILGICIGRKTKAAVSSFFIGCGIFILFAMILEQLLHTLVLTAAGEILSSNLFLYGLYGGLAAALFEESGRLIAMKYCMKKRLNRGNALMYGAGHGGAEALLIAGLTSADNILTSMLINQGGITQAMAQLEPEVQTATYGQLRALWETPAYQFYLGGLERISAMALHICLSVFVYKAVKTGQRQYFMAALLLHFLVDFLTIIMAAFLPALALEAVLLIFALLFIRETAKLYRAGE